MYLGIDLGTGTLKAAIVDGSGEVVVAAEESYETRFAPGGKADFDARVWWDACVRVVRRVTKSHGDSVQAIGIAGQMHGVVLVDGAGRPVRRAVLWPDHRADGVLEAFVRFNRIHGDVLANPIVPGMAGPILAWMARNEPGSLQKSALAVQPKDWLRIQLCPSSGVTDASDASATLLYDVSGDRWSDALCEAVGVDQSLLPPIESSTEVVGRIGDDIAALLGVPEVPVVVGAGDAAAALLGAGVESPGTALINTGTGGQVMTPLWAPTTGGERAAGLHQYRSASTSAPWYAMAAIANGGLALDWVRDIVGYDWDRVYGLAGSVLEQGSADPLFLPFLAVERKPSHDAPVGAAWSGLTLAHDADALVRSALRGVAFYLAHRARSLMAEAGVVRAVMSGGSARHLAWVELVATALGVEVAIARDAHLTVRGAARLAARGLGTDFPDPIPGQTISPRTDVEVSGELDRFDGAVSRHFSLRPTTYG